MINKYDYWRLLRILKTEYDKQYTGYYEPSNTGFTDSFDKYVERQYGLRVVFDYAGMIKEDVVIVNEGKYAWCLLKHK